MDLHGFSDTINGLSGAGTVDDTAPATTATLTVGGNNQTASFSGVIQNSGAGATTSLTKIGTGTETLSGASTYGGQTSIQNGALSVSTLNSFSGGTASSSLGTPVTVANDARSTSGMPSRRHHRHADHHRRWGNHRPHHQLRWHECHQQWRHYRNRRRYDAGSLHRQYDRVGWLRPHHLHPPGQATRQANTFQRHHCGHRYRHDGPGEGAAQATGR